MKIRMVVYALVVLSLWYLWFSLHRTPPIPASPHTEFNSAFTVDGNIEETNLPEESTSPYWWVDSGGRFMVATGTGSTLTGDVAESDRWHREYAQTNPEDSDYGLHPQNIFRLITKQNWDSVRVEVECTILGDHVSSSTRRNESNGILLMSRYSDDGETLYYVGVRIDGTAIIKKKYRGTYYTMAQKQIYPGTYSRTLNPNVLPHGEWIGIRSDTQTLQDGRVSIKLYIRARDASWQLILDATDDGTLFDGSPPIRGPGYIGIRSDFMDVQYRNFRAVSI